MNPKVLEIHGSLIRLLASKKKPSSLDVGLGEPSLRPNPAHFAYAMDYVAEHGMHYTPNAGDPELRTAIAAHYGYAGLDSAENVCVTTGSQEAMYVTLTTLLDPAKDEILIVEPTFASYGKMAALNGVTIRTVPMSEEEDFAFDAERIIAAITERTRAIVICSPCNPTARVLTQQQAHILIAALDRRNAAENAEPIWLIHDEVYREQSFVKTAADLGRMYPYTIVTNSLSKSNALTGLRLGWIIAPQTFIEQAIKCHAWVTACTDTFAQAVARHIFASSTGENSMGSGVEEHHEWYRKQRDAVVEILRESGLRYLPIEGSFYACVQIPEGRTSLDTSLGLLERADVVAIPGIAFGSSFDRWLRLSWVAPTDRFREALARIAAFY